MGKKNKGEKKDVVLNMDEMDEATMNAMQVEMDPSAIPNLDILLGNIQDLLNDIESDEMQELAKFDKKEFEKRLTFKYFQGKDVPLKIVNLMLEEERYDNLEKLLDMFDRLKSVQKGEVEINEAYKKFSEKMNETYVYSKHGGKEQFEKSLSKDKQN